MSNENRVVIYEFKIKAVSPVYFGSDKQGELIKNSKGEPVLLGNSIGGALRNYLQEGGVLEDIIFDYLGGNKKNSEKFEESRIFISDGKITEFDEIYSKEGTAVDPVRGTAKENEKYTLEYLPIGTVITFRVECDLEASFDEYFHEIIGIWQEGFENKAIKLGGQQNNGFGQFFLEKLCKKEFKFCTQADLDEYIFNFDNIGFEPVEDKVYHKISNKNKITFSIEGEFPYGVYQSFKDDLELTGLQKRNNSYYIPATSFKGLLRNEIRILLGRFLNCDEELIDIKIAEIFGDKEQKGKLMFSDIVFDTDKSGTVKVKRYDKDKIVDGDPIYIKVDRLTGGAYDGALKTQREVWGRTVLQFQLITNQLEDSPFIFPLIYVMMRIGSGLVPLGGRTAIGLGEFSGDNVKLSGALEDEYPSKCSLSEEQKSKMQVHYNSFKRWCTEDE